MPVSDAPVLFITPPYTNRIRIPGAETRSLELHSPDGIHSCILRATDAQEALAWFNALHSAMARSTQKALLDANRALTNHIGELKYIGWLSRRTFNEPNGRSSSESSDEADRWQPVFVAVTDRELRYVLPMNLTASLFVGRHPNAI